MLSVTKKPFMLDAECHKEALNAACWVSQISPSFWVSQRSQLYADCRYADCRCTAKRLCPRWSHFWVCWIHWSYTKIIFLTNFTGQEYQQWSYCLVRRKSIFNNNISSTSLKIWPTQILWVKSGILCNKCYSERHYAECPLSDCRGALCKLTLVRKRIKAYLHVWFQGTILH